jgi:hypothetical protein
MIENLVDKAIAALLATISGLNVVIGMEDPYPNLQAPFCVVHSVVDSFDGKTPVYKLLTTIEYESIPGPDSVANVVSVMSSIDTVLSTQPSGAVLATLPLSGMTYLAWKAINKTQQEAADRRKNVRELQVFAQMS